MLILNLLLGTILGAVQLVLAGAAALYLYQDYRRGWPMLRNAGNRGRELTGRLLGHTPDEDALADRAVKRYAQSVAQFREALAKVKANKDLYRRRAGEENALAAEFRQLIDTALSRGDEEAAEAAAVGSTNAARRAEVFGRNVGRLEESARLLERRLDTVSAEYEAVVTQAQTVKMHSAVATANRSLYEAISMVDVKSGQTAKGELATLLLQAEERELTSHHLLELADKGGDGIRKKILEDAGVAAEIDEARKRLALLPPQDSTTELITEEMPSSDNGGSVRPDMDD